MATDKRPSLDEIFGTTTSAEKPINTVAERPSLDEIFGPSDEKKEQPKTNEWGEPVYPFEKPVEVEGARLNDFLTPTIFEPKPNAKSEAEPPKKAKEEKPYSPEGLLPIAESGQAEMPQGFISPKVFEKFTPEEKLMLDVDKATDSAFNAAQEEATKQMVAERKERGTFGVMDEFGEGAAEKIAYRQRAGADAVIKRTFESISADDIHSIIENRVANNEEFKAKKQAFDDEVKRIMPNSNDNLSDAEVEALFANMTPEERETAEKQIAETTQALEALQAQFASDVEAIYKSESKDVEAQINNRIINRLAKLNLPQNDLEYIGKAIYNNSLVGILYEMGLNVAAGGSGTDYIVSQQALAQAKPSAIAKVVGGAGAILADGAIFGALGAGGSLAGVGMRELATKVVAGQIARKAAVSATNSAVKATARRIVEQNVLQQFASAATAQAITLGGYNGLLTAAQETLSPTGENGAYNWRNILTRFGEGLLTGIALGGVSVGTSAAKGAMYRARPDMAYTATGMAADLGVSLAGFTAENAAFLGIGSIVSGEEITAEAIGESVATLGLLKGIGALKRVAKGEKLMQQPDFVQRTISDLKFTKEEMDAMRNAGVDMEQIDIVSEAVREVLNTSNKSQIAQETISSRPLMDVYNSVMASREVPISAKIKLQYIVNGTAPRIVGATSLTVSNTNGVPTVKAYDANSRLVQVREFENMAEAESFVNKAQPLLERNNIIEGEKVLRGGQIAVTIQQAIEQYAKENPNTDARTLFTELMIDLGYVKGEVSASSRERVDAIKSRIKEQFVDPASQLVDGIARKYGTTVESVYRALNIKPDLRTVREAQLAKAYVDALKQFNESMSGPIEAEQARYNAQMKPQIEQGKQEIVDAQRETEFVRNSLNEAAKRMATADGKQIAIVRLENGEQVAVHTGRIVLREDGTIDHKASEQTIVIKRIDAEGNEQRDSVGIDDIAEVIEQDTPEEAVEASMSVLEAQATKKLSLDKALSENGEQGVEVVAIDGTRGKIVGIDENGSYILRAKGESGKEVDVPVSINDVETINAEQPATTEQAAVADAVEKVVEDAATEPVEVVYDDDFPPLTEEDMAPQLDADKIQWEKLSPEDYTSASAMLYGDATTLADSHIYHTNSRAKLAKAKQSVAEQQKVIDKLNSRFATMSSPAEAQKLRKQVAAAEEEKAKRELAVKNIEEQMAKYAHAMRKYGIEVAAEDSLLAERTRLEEERNALLEADKELDRYEQEEATKGKKAIANTAANRKYIEQLYADRFSVSPAQAGPRQAILWDLANGAIKLRWDNVTTDSGAVQKGLAAELGLSAAEKRIYKAVTDNKNGQSVDAYAHDLWQGAEWGQEVDDMTLKDMILDVLQSTPNGSIALKELADMSGVQADLEAQISLGKGDIQRKLEEVDANLAKNAQQMADFRKRINDTVQKLESGEPLILPVGEGEFGPIYDQFRGKPQEAVDFLLAEKNGEAIGALTHPEIGDVSLVYGNEFAGLEKIAQKHPEVLQDIQGVLDTTRVKQSSDNRIVLEGPSHKVVVSKMLGQKETPQWLLTAYEKNSATGGSSDIDPEPTSGKQNGTATLQNTASESKDTTTIPDNQISEEEIFGNAPISEDIPFMIEPAAKTSSNGFVPTPQREITYSNFYERTGAVFSQVERPNREPDYISRKTMQPDKVSSEYWYGEDEGGKFVIRGSDHWSAVAKKPESVEAMYDHYVNSKVVPVRDPRIASCWWGIATTDPSKPILYGKVYLDNIKDLTHDKETAIASRADNFNREVFDAFAGHLGETLGAESVITDAAEANRVLEWHQAVGERLRTAVRENAEIAAMDSEYEQAIIDKDYDKALSLLDAAAEIAMPESKVRDNDGKLIRVTHYTNAEFTEFDPDKIGSATDYGVFGRGFYFGNKDHRNYGSKRYEGYLNLTNPIILNGSKEAYEFKKRMAEFSKSDVLKLNADVVKAYTEHLKAEGYDGVIFNDELGNNEYVAFYPNQFKLADFVEIETYDNNGNIIPLSQRFNFGTNDIRFAIEAYHGSGADFEKFDHSFMSTGEGAQAFGWGTYVTEVEGIAKKYAEAIGRQEQKRAENFAQQNLLDIRKEIADNRKGIEVRQRWLSGLKEDYAKLESSLSSEEQKGNFTQERASVQIRMQDLREDINSTQALIDSAQAKIDKLLPLEQVAETKWQAVTAEREIARLKEQLAHDEASLQAALKALAENQNRYERYSESYKAYKAKLKEIAQQYGKRSSQYENYELEGEYIEFEYKRTKNELDFRKESIERAQLFIADTKAKLAELEQVEYKKFRNLYSVEVPDNTGDNYLSWKDELPKAHAERINNALAQRTDLREEFVEADRDMMFKRDGHLAYMRLDQLLGSDKAASEFLHSIGFTGIEYPAQYTTGGRADGAKNYVIFNADDVKIVDHVQYFKTPNGEVYGFVYEDKIYLDPTNIDPKAPVHEYTELWCREVAKANKPLWDRGKELVKQTKVWEEVNADENYKHQSEDLRASEAWSRIIADEMTGKARQYGSKGLMAKLRGWLRSFWKTVKSVVEKWTKKELEDLTVEQFKKMTMADFINKVDPRKWNAKRPTEVSKSLVGIHNISLDKLQKALKQGGLANPSAAVIDIAKGDHFDYGEYSFIMPKSLVDKKSGRNIGTFDRDAWTPLYPSVEYSHSKESRKNLNKLVEGLDEGLADKIKRETLAKVNGNGFYSGLQIVFLKERGVEVPIASKAGKFFGTINEFKQLFGDKEPTYENYQALDKAQKDEVTLWIRAKGMPEEIARYKELLVKPARKEGLWNFLLDDVGYGKFDQAVNGLQADARNVGTPDYEKTIDNAVNYIRENGLQEEFDAWQSETFNNLGFDERIQVGWSPSGDRIMRKNTLENVSKYMRRQGKNASADHWSNSEGKMLAQLVQNFSSLDKIRANKGRLRSAADDVVGIRKRINEMAQVFMNFAKHTDLFMEEQKALAYLEDILVGGMDPDKVVAEFNAATKRNITLTEEQKAEMKQLREDMKSIPVQYFETKFERPVMFNEFAAVVAPDTMPESVEQQLRDAGLAIYKYNPDVEGDRRKATLAATASEDIRFMIVGEKGAAALDQAEEATTRLDNLAVAREMEADFAERASRLEKLRNAEPIEITGNEVTPSEDLEQYRKNAREYANTLRGEYTNNDTGAVVEVNRNSIKEILHHDYKDVPHIVSVAAIPQIIEKGVYIASEKNEGNKDVDSFDYYVAGLRIGGVDYTVKSVISNRKDGSRYYDHKLTQIEKGRLLDLSAVSSTESANKAPISDIKDKRLLDILQINSKENAKKIKLATGWERGADGKWRYEIGDAKIKDTKDVGGTVVVRYEDDMLWNSGNLGDIVDAPELFEAYPQLRDVRLDTDALPTEPNNGTYYPSTMSIKINADNIATLNSILNHEIQHAIQHIEGFASGSNLSVAKKEVEELSNKAAIWRFRNDIAAYMREHPDTYPSQVQKKVMELYAMTDGLIEEGESLSKEDIEELEARGFFPFEDGRIKAFNLWARGYDGEGYEYAYNLWRERKIPTAYERYKRTIGETEARNVQKRMRMSPEERRATLLSETEDVAREDQIFLNNGLYGNSTISRMIIGEKGAVELDRVEEATTRLDNLAVAREMEASNRDAKAIKLATGWERGADGKWRYEIDDFKLKSDTALVKNQDNQIVTTLGEVIDDEALFTAFPELRKLSVVSLPNQEYGGHYQDGSIMPHIALGNKLFTPSTKRLVELEKEFDKAMSSEQEDALMSEFNAEVERAVAQPEFYTLVTSAAKKVLVHEVQHAIQRIEGFARGGSWELERPDNDAEMLRLRDAVRGARAYIDHFKGDDIAMAIRDGKKYNYLEWRSISPESQQILLEYLGRKRKVNYADFRAYLDNAHKMTLPKQYGMSGYRKFAGEVESRNAEARMYMTPEERRATLLSETEDVAREDQIFLESNLGVAQSVEVSEPVEAPTRKPRKSATEKSLEKIDSLREQLQNKKRSLENTLADVYNFLTSKDIAETMAEGVGKAQYRSVIKNAIEAIGKAYNITDAEEKRKVVFRYLGEIDDNLSQMLTRQRLNEVTEILDKALYGYTAQGVRTGKRIDEHTREIFDMLRNVIAEPVEEERDERGYRKPVHYRLKNRTEAGDITASFRLRTQSANDAGVIAKLRSDADEIINSVDDLDTATTRKAAQLEYTANLLEKYDNTLQMNEAIGQSTDEIAQILDNIDRVREKYKAAAVGSEERKNLYGLLKQLKTDLESEKMNRANLRHRYAAMLKTFTTSLEQLDEKGASEFVRAEQEKAEAAIKWRKGIYDSIKNPNAPVLPVGSKDRKGEEITVNWKGLNTRAKINESVFMATFAEMSRDIDINSIPGQWLPDGWNYQFMLAPGGYMERTDWRYKTEKALRDELDAEILKLSGDKKTDDPYKLFAALAQEPSGMTIQRMAVSTNKEGKVVGGYQENIPLTIGQLLYMRNTLRQPNGFAGYNAWGFSETYMQNIVEYVEEKYPQYCRFFDWVVSEFMPKLYDMQDAIYFKKFGTHLPKTAFYFPFVRDKRMVGKVAEVGEGEVSLPSSVTGNIVERVKTSAKMDLEADAFSVLQDHIKETLDWCAYVELTDKFNSVGTSHAFGNLLKAQGVSVQKLKEMYEVAVGQGKINSTDNTTLTKTLNAISKGLVAGNIVLNPNAAIKQIVSATATLGYSANPKLLAIWAKNFFVPSVIKTGVGKVVQQLKSGEIDPIEAIDWKVVGDNWKWAIENIPTLRERWEGREAGFEVLKSHSFDSWDKLTAMITNAGLAPNAFVDMLTCSNAAKTVYEYEYPRLLERGRSKKEAHREACVKAAIFINETQQSSLNGFLSSFQSGGGLQRILGVGLGAYQNSSMAFARNERFALANMLRMANSSTRKDMEMRQIAAYKELGVEDAKAVELAKQDIKECYGQQVLGFVHNGVLNNYIWKIAGVLLGGLASAGFAAMFDKDEWNKLWKNEKFRQELASAVSAETLVWQTPLLYNAPITKQILEYSHNVAVGKAYGGIFEAPTSQSAQDLIDAIFKQWIGVKNEVTGEREKKEPTRYDRSAEWLVVSTLVKAGLGVNPDLVVRMAQGIDDMIKDGVQVEDVMATLSSPRGLTRAIAGEPRQGETKEEYLDRMAYIYRQINAQDKRFVKERTKEYIDNKDNELYRTLGIVPREERILEQKVKAIRKQLLFFDRSDEGVAEFRALPEAERKKQIEIAKRYDKITKLTKEMYQGILPFDEAGVSKRKQELQKRHDMMREVYDMWIEYNNK